MFHKKLCVAFIAFLLLHETVQGKKSRKNKRPEHAEEDHTPQPSVVSYSTFGFNDVGTYEGFVPSSPDYAKFLSGTSQDSSTRVQSSDFPTSPDSNDFGNSFGSQPYSGQTLSEIEDGGSQTSLVQYPQNSMGFFNTPSFDTSVDNDRNIASDEINGRNTEEVNAPTYGTKINSRNKARPVNQYNYTEYSGPSGIQNEEKFPNFHETKPVSEKRPYYENKPTYENKPLQGDLGTSFYNVPSYPSTSTAEYNKPITSDTQNQLKFQRVVDFTKSNQYYPSDLDTSRLPTSTPIADLYENDESSQNKFMNTYNINNNNNNKPFFAPVTKHREAYEQNNNEDNFQKNTFKTSNIKEDSNNFNGYLSGKDNLLTSNSDTENKKKTKPWLPGGHLFKKWKEPSPSKGYEYSTNYSTMSFKYDADENKMTKPLGSSIDQLIPASSNIELSKYHYPETDYTNFKKMPEYKVHEDNEFENFPSFKDTSKPNEFDYNQYKHLYTTTPSATSHWGNAFKSSGHSTYLKSFPISNKYKYRENDEVVNIPRRPNKQNYENPFENNSNEWSQYNRRPHKNRPHKDWNNEVPTTRFKSEEDLLGLRNQDTSHPSYLPSYQASNMVSEEVEYKKLVDKWRQSYIKSKYKDSPRDYESYGSEARPMHVPVPKPYPVQVPVVKPYPVHIPYIRPVFHHSKGRDEYDTDYREDDDYSPRQENKNKYFQYKKKKIPNGSRNRSRRPSRTAYHDRNRRRWPDRRHPADTREDLPRMRPTVHHRPSPFKRRDTEITRFEEKPYNYHLRP